MEKNQKWLNKFIADSRTREHASDSMSIEEAMFSVFTETISATEILPNIFYQKYKSIFKNKPYEVWGFQKSFQDNILEYSVFICDFLFNENITNALKIDIESSIKRVSNFFEFTFDGFLSESIDDFHDIKNTIDDIKNFEAKYGLASLKVFFLTNKQIKNLENLPEVINIKNNEYEARIHYWDLTRWGEVITSKSKREPISFHFNDLSYKVKLITLENNQNDIKTHVGIIPTQLLFDLYSKYDVKLLENNVRVHLQRKNNQKMGETLINNPKMFVSYNNGLSATCKELKVSKDGFAEFIDDFQIVNGGQTTATIFYTKANRNTRELCDLSKSFVQIKITEVPNKGHHEELVPEISRYSNTQTAVNQSDFFAADPKFIITEKFTKQHFVRPLNSKQNIFYYFERMSGQYDEELKRQGNPDTRPRKEFEIKYPKKLRFDKLDLARWANLINDLPHIANTGKEKSFDVFVKGNKDFKPSPFWIKSVIGAGEVFKYTRALYGYSNRKTTPLFLGENTDVTLGQTVSIFVVSCLNYFSKGLFCFHKIYDFKIEVSQLEPIIKELMEAIYYAVLDKGGASAQEQSKTEAMWIFLKNNIKIDLAKLNEYLITPEEKMRLSEFKSESQIEFFKLADKYLNNGARELVALNDFVKTTTKIEYTEKKGFERIFNRICNLQMTLKISDFELINEVLLKANNLGFKNVRKENLISAYQGFNLEPKLIEIEKLIGLEEEDIPVELRDLIENFKISTQLKGSELIKLSNSL
jgi:hypothetical protein